MIETVRGNYGYILLFSLQDNVGETVNIVNATAATFRAQLNKNDSVQFSEPMNIVNASGGQCSYSVQATDFSVPGKWNAQIVVTFPTEVITFPGITVQVDDQVPV